MTNANFLGCALAGLLTLGTALPAAAQQSSPVQRGFLLGGIGSQIGVSIRELREADLAAANLTRPDGVFIEAVQASTPAERAGIKAGDIIVEYDSERVRGTGQFSRLVQETPAGRAVPVIVNRSGTRQTLQVTPEASRFGSIDLERWRDRIEGGLQDFPFGIGQRTAERRLGLTLVPLSSQLAAYFGVKNGVLVSDVVADSPAAHANIKAGDVLITVDGRTIDSPADVLARLRAARAGDTLAVTLIRDRKDVRTEVRLGNADGRRERDRDTIGI